MNTLVNLLYPFFLFENYLNTKARVANVLHVP
jgi:hypothetical protein